jgi:hypothetical protein
METFPFGWLRATSTRTSKLVKVPQSNVRPPTPSSGVSTSAGFWVAPDGQPNAPGDGRWHDHPAAPGRMIMTPDRRRERPFRAALKLYRKFSPTTSTSSVRSHDPRDTSVSGPG